VGKKALFSGKPTQRGGRWKVCVEEWGDNPERGGCWEENHRKIHHEQEDFAGLFEKMIRALEMGWGYIPQLTLEVKWGGTVYGHLERFRRRRG